MRLLLTTGLVLLAAGCGGPPAHDPTTAPALPAELAAELACCEHPDTCAPHARRLDPELREEPADQAVLSPTASYTLDTGGDSMGVGGCRGLQVGLWVRVAVGRRVLHRQIASCDDAGVGEPPGEAVCDGRRLVLVVLPDAVVVREGEVDVVRIPLGEPVPAPPTPASPPRQLGPTEELRTAAHACHDHGEAFSERMGRCLCETACRVSRAFAPPPGERVSVRLPFVDIDGLALDLDEQGRALTCAYTAVGHPVDVHLTCPR